MKHKSLLNLLTKCNAQISKIERYASYNEEKLAHISFWATFGKYCLEWFTQPENEKAQNVRLMSRTDSCDTQSDYWAGIRITSLKQIKNYLSKENVK